MKQTKLPKLRHSASGFTIIELMIALSVLAILLLISTLTLMNLGKMYVKGNNQALIQNTARNIIADISSQLQLGGATPNLGGMFKPDTNNYKTQGVFCIGTTRYDYLVGQDVDGSDGTSTPHALWRDTMTSGGSCPALPMNATSPPPSDGLTTPNSGVELIPNHVRLTELEVAQVGSGLYSISIGLAYGDDDLLCVHNASLGTGSDCDSSQIANNRQAHASNLEQQNQFNQVTCLGNIGQQFCATSYLSVTVARRLVTQ